MADYDTFMFYAGVYPNAALAEEDYGTIKDIYYTTNLIDTFDAAVVAKEANGKVKIHKKHEEPTRRGAWKGAGWGLATGLVVALFPAAVIGGGLLAATTGVGSGLGAIAGHAAGGMSRSDLKDLGELLDNGEAALVVAAASEMAPKVEAAMKQADNIEKREGRVDTAALAADIQGS
jgi:uncharacterized membrane protein